jgi:hypothetical protein
VYRSARSDKPANNIAEARYLFEPIADSDYKARSRALVQHERTAVVEPDLVTVSVRASLGVVLAPGNRGMTVVGRRRLGYRSDQPGN